MKKIILLFIGILFVGCDSNPKYESNLAVAKKWVQAFEDQNIELWKELDAMSKFHKVDWFWVKGHSNHRENDLADALANRGIEELI